MTVVGRSSRSGLTDATDGKRRGKEMARRLEVFRMEVVYHGRDRQPDLPYTHYPVLEAMAREVDWLIVIASAPPSTDGIVSRRVLVALGPEG